MDPEKVPALCRDYLPADLAPLLRRAGVDGTILVQAAQTAAETDFLLGLAEDTQFVAGVVGWLTWNSEVSNIDLRLEGTIQSSAASARCCRTSTTTPGFSRPAVLRSLAVLAEQRFPFEFSPIRGICRTS